MYTNSTLFSRSQLAKPGPVSEDNYEVEKVIAYCEEPRSAIVQYKVHKLGYSLEDD